MCLRKHNALIYMCLCIQFWFVKSRQLYKTPTITMFYTKKKNLHVRKLHKTCTCLPCYTYTVTTQVYVITMSHIHSREKNLQSYHVTHPK